MYYSFLIWWLSKDNTTILRDIKLFAPSPRDAVAMFFIYGDMQYHNKKKLNVKEFHYPARTRVENRIVRIYEYERVCRRGKTVVQYRLINEIPIEAILKQFPK